MNPISSVLRDDEGICKADEAEKWKNRAKDHG